MVGQSVARRIEQDAQVMSFDTFAGYCALATAVANLAYAIAFVIVKDVTFYSIALMLGGVLASAVLVALYRQLRQIEASFAQWGAMLALAGAFGSVIHGGYDLANAINPPAANPDLPSQIDPRGLLTFAFAGLGLLVLSTCMSRARQFPKGLVYTGYVLAVLLVALYLGRLIILDAKNPAILLTAAVTGFVVSPLWYAWTGITFLRTRRA